MIHSVRLIEVGGPKEMEVGSYDCAHLPRAGEFIRLYPDSEFAVRYEVRWVEHVFGNTVSESLVFVIKAPKGLT